MSIIWNDSIYTSIPVDIGLSTRLMWRSTPPADWSEAQPKPHEETLQTLLAFHLTEICGESLTLAGTAGDYWGGADITGFDSLGKVHLFELKRHTVNQDSAHQLLYYLLRHIFDDPAKFINAWIQRMRDKELQISRLSKTIAGVLAGHRTDNIGDAFVREQLASVTISKAAWKKLDEERQQSLSIAALLELAKRNFKNVPTPEQLEDIAKQWHKRLHSTLTSFPQTATACASPIVIWLVGSKFTDDAEHEIRKWRAAGLDARCLQAEVRFSAQQNGLILRVQSEKFPERTELMQCLREWFGNNNSDDIAKISLHLYHQARPSNKMKNEDGLPLAQPYALIEYKKGRPLILSVNNHRCASMQTQ